MKLKSIHIMLIVILVVGIFMLTSSDSVVPYSKDTLFSNMYKYEGMDGLENTDGHKSFQDYVSNNTKLPSPLSQSDYSAAVASKKESIAGLFGSNGEPKMVEGFALQPAPFGDSHILDRFGSTSSGSQCFGKSSGYSNSLGPLCLSQEDARLLSTRGGNLTGNDSTIGL
jgi:hypothetical protein